MDAMFFVFNYVQLRVRRDVDDVVAQFGSGRHVDAMVFFLKIWKHGHLREEQDEEHMRGTWRSMMREHKTQEAQQEEREEQDEG